MQDLDLSKDAVAAKSGGVFSRNSLFALVSLLASAAALTASGASDHACVWRVTAPGGGTLYLGGSVHALRSVDYPLPPAYNRAFDASERLVFENDPSVSPWSVKRLFKSAEYPKGDSLKNHVDPRTYNYLKRVFTLENVPEEKFAHLRPWALIIVLWSPALHGLSQELGIEGYLERRARANAKPVTGLESFHEHMGILSGLSDRQAEAVILMTFIPQTGGESRSTYELEAWRRGDADALERLERTSFGDFPAFADRIVDARNRNWIPKIERALHSGHTYFVVVGAAHMGGRNGLLALLRDRGYRIEQL
jgi:uncharacterized protein YbaP (TraB family)